MSIELTEQDLQAVVKGEPFRFVAPTTNVELVVLRGDIYDRLKQLFANDDVDPEIMYPLLADIVPKDWEHPSAYGISREP